MHLRGVLLLILHQSSASNDFLSATEVPCMVMDTGMALTKRQQLQLEVYRHSCSSACMLLDHSSGLTHGSALLQHDEAA